MPNKAAGGVNRVTVAPLIAFAEVVARVGSAGRTDAPILVAAEKCAVVANAGSAADVVIAGGAIAVVGEILLCPMGIQCSMFKCC